MIIAITVTTVCTEADAERGKRVSERGWWVEQGRNRGGISRWRSRSMLNQEVEVCYVLLRGWCYICFVDVFFFFVSLGFWCSIFLRIFMMSDRR